MLTRVFLAASIIAGSSISSPCLARPVRMILEWQSDEARTANSYMFVYNPTLGLHDIDDHLITDEGWKHMKAPNSEAVAQLFISDHDSLGGLKSAIAIMHSHGWNRVQIVIQDSSNW